MNAAALESSLGELLIVGFPGTEFTAEARERLMRVRPSGVIFFAANFGDADQAAGITRSVHETIGAPELPALVCADEEGGMVSQISGFWEVPPSARAHPEVRSCSSRPRARSTCKSHSGR